jgi:hypothetical protein
MAAAAATLLVVVPAKPWRAKHRFAALRINCRLRSLVMRKVDMRVSNHSPWKNVKYILRCTTFRIADQTENATSGAKRQHKPGLDGKTALNDHA